jgi:aerobic-type carbon monoxide dehydrogenase small subunit (CoxS/CutS family)
MLTFKLNGQRVQSNAPLGESLLSVLTEDFQINGSKFGCGLQQCGSCTVLVDGNPLRACGAPVSSVAGRSVQTLEGLTQGGKPSRLQQAFIDEQAAQCGYCTSGMILTAHALLERNPNPTDQEVRQALDANLCRCGAHNRIVHAVLRAAKKVGV